MTADRYTISSLDRAIDVLEVLAEAEAGMTLAELTRETEVPKSTLFRILSTLQERNCVRLDEDAKEYTLGLKLWELGSAVMEKSDLDSAAAPFMKTLAERCEESVFLAVREGADVVYVRRMESPNSVMMVRKLGHRAPAYCTATGTAMLAFLPEADRRALLDAADLRSHTPSTCTGREALLRRLRAVRTEGVAVVDGEYNAELLCVAAPVLGRNGRPEAALTVAMPSGEADEERVEAVKAEVREQALGLSRRMGYLAGHEAHPGREAPA